MHMMCGKRGIMNEAAIDARRAYKRKWARENPDKVKAAQERYWTRKAQQAAQAEQAQQEPQTGESE